MQPAGSADSAGEPPGIGAAGAGSPGSGGAPGETGGTAAPAAYDHVMEQVQVSGTLVIAAGTTLRVGPGTTFNAAMGAKIRVEGTLIVEGSADARVRFVGGSAPRSWHGIEIASGGRLQMIHAEIGGATYGIHALAGSSFAVDRAEIGTSFKAAVLEADGTFDHTRFHASGDPTFSAVNEVSIDDVNGTLTIIDASPTISNSTFDGSFALVDMIRVGGNASPVFDHLYIKDAHCGIHANGGTNNAPKITNTVFEALAYGLMIYATKPTIEDSVFIDNRNDLGFCFGATEANAPSLTRNFYSAGEAVIDPSCFQIGTTDASPAATKNPAAGPSGL